MLKGPLAWTASSEDYCFQKFLSSSLNPFEKHIWVLKYRLFTRSADGPHMSRMWSNNSVDLSAFHYGRLECHSLSRQTRIRDDFLRRALSLIINYMIETWLAANLRSAPMAAPRHLSKIACFIYSPVFFTDAVTITCFLSKQMTNCHELSFAACKRCVI